jgi:hypothetical protein
MRKCVALPLLAALATTGCVTYNRGQLLGASTIPGAADEGVLIAHRVEGRACGGLPVHRLQDAIEDALDRAPGADALTDASFYFEGLCLVVRGRAIRRVSGD